MIGQRIKELRINANLTQTELAKIIGVKPAQVSQYESDKRTPRLDKFYKLLDVFGVTADYILGREVSAISDDEEYKVKLSRVDLNLLSVIKSYPRLYKKLSSDPERKIKYLSGKINSIIPD